MQVVTLIHASFEKPGVITQWAQARGHCYQEVHTYQNESVPPVNDIDFLIVMGGPQSPRQVEEFSYLEHEINLIKECIVAGKLVIGFCLGAQLIAEAVGAPVEKSPEKEVGVYLITLTEAGQQDLLFEGFPTSFPVIHWHNDMPGLPEGGDLLAFSLGCPRQAFKYSDKVYGFQFHMEITKELAEGMIAHCPEDLEPSPFTQTAEQFLTQDFKSINERLWVLLDRLAARV